MYSLCVICPKWKAWSMRFRAHEIYSSQNYATYCPFLVSYKSVQLACILLNFIFTCCCRLIYSFAQILPWHIQMDICSYYRYRTPPQSARRQASVVGHYCCGTHFLNGWMHRPFVQRHRSCEHWTVPADRHLRYMHTVHDRIAPSPQVSWISRLAKWLTLFPLLSQVQSRGQMKSHNPGLHNNSSPFLPRNTCQVRVAAVVGHAWYLKCVFCELVGSHVEQKSPSLSLSVV